MSDNLIARLRYWGGDVAYSPIKETPLGGYCLQAADRIEALEAQVAAADRLAGLLEEAADDITAYVGAEYPLHDHARYPEVAKRHYRDMELVRRATTALTAYRAARVQP